MALESYIEKLLLLSCESPSMLTHFKLHHTIHVDGAVYRKTFHSEHISPRWGGGENSYSKVANTGHESPKLAQDEQH